MEKKRTVFLTGATGLVGSYLLKVLLDNGHKVYALARNKNNKSARQRVEDILNFWDENAIKRYNDNLVVVEGDIIKKNLGINKYQKNIGNETEEIFHCAANTQFNASIKSLKLVNIEGVKNLLNLALKWFNKWRNLKRVNYISTVYICGDYNERFTESHMNVGQRFNSYYEESKFKSEVICQEFRNRGLWIDIYRPAGITGEYKTGKTFQFEHIYRLLRLWELEILDTFPLKDMPIHIVPIDYVAKAILLLNKSTQKTNNTFHIFNEKPISPEYFFESAKRTIGFTKPVLTPWDDFDAATLSPAQQYLVKKAFTFYSITQGKLESSYTSALLANSGFIFPEIDQDYISRMIKYRVFKRGHLNLVKKSIKKL
jgi:thioester reductase-like protein